MKHYTLKPVTELNNYELNKSFNDRDKHFGKLITLHNKAKQTIYISSNHLLTSLLVAKESKTNLTLIEQNVTIYSYAKRLGIHKQFEIINKRIGNSNFKSFLNFCNKKEAQTIIFDLSLIDTIGGNIETLNSYSGEIKESGIKQIFIRALPDTFKTDECNKIDFQVRSFRKHFELDVMFDGMAVMSNNDHNKIMD